MDPAARDFILRTILTNYSEDASVILSTHLIADIEKVLDEVIFFKGRAGGAPGSGGPYPGAGEKNPWTPCSERSLQCPWEQWTGIPMEGKERDKMFRKLFKYEWTAMMRSLFPVYGAVLAVTVLNALMFHVIVPEAGRTELLDSPFLELIPWFTGAFVRRRAGGPGSDDRASGDPAVL